MLDFKDKNFKLLFIEDHILPLFCAEYRFKWDQKSESSYAPIKGWPTHNAF